MIDKIRITKQCSGSESFKQRRRCYLKLNKNESSSLMIMVFEIRCILSLFVPGIVWNPHVSKLSSSQLGFDNPSSSFLLDQYFDLLASVEVLSQMVYAFLLIGIVLVHRRTISQIVKLSLLYGRGSIQTASLSALVLFTLWFPEKLPHLSTSFDNRNYPIHPVLVYE